MANVGYATLQVIPSMQGIGAALSSGIAGPAASAGASAGGIFAGRFSGAMLAGGAIAAAAAGLGVAAFQIGQDFDDAYDTIRVGTGATGSALEGLKDDFKATFADVPSSMGDVATATADLNTRLGLTGEPLQRLSAQVLNLSRITDTDLGTNIQTVTRAFGDWSVSTDDMSGAMDKLFRASQATGAPVDQLAQSITDFGSPLRQLGFSMEESIALFGRFEKEGVNTETVMAGMRQATKNLGSGFAEEVAGVSDFGDILEGVKDGTFDLTDAMAVFGARAGTDVFKAIEEGRFELSEYLDIINNGSDTIDGASKATMSWREALDLLKNNALLAVEPIASRFFDLVSAGAIVLADAAKAFSEDGLAGALQVLRDAWDGLSGPMQIAVGVIGGLVVAGAVAAGVALLGAAFGLLTGSVLLPVLAIAALVAGLVWAYNEFEGFRNVVDSVAQFLVGTVWPAIQSFASMVAEQFGNLVAWVSDHWAEISEAVGRVLTMMQANVEAGLAVIRGLWSYFGQDLLNMAQDAWNFISRTVQNAVEFIAGVIELVVAVINGDWSAAWEALKGIVATAWDQLLNVLRLGWEQLKNLFSVAIAAVQLIWSSSWSQLKTMVGLAWEGIKAAVAAGINAMMAWITALPGRINAALAGLPGLLISAGRGLMNGLRSGAVSAWGVLRDWIAGRGSAILSAIGDLGSVLVDIGRAVIDGLKEGMQSAWRGVTGWLSGLNPASHFNDINPYKGHAAKNLVGVGEAVMGGLRSGMQTEWAVTARWLSGLDPADHLDTRNLSHPGEFARVAGSRPTSTAGVARSTDPASGAEVAAAFKQALRSVGLKATIDGDRLYVTVADDGRRRERGQRAAVR